MTRDPKDELDDELQFHLEQRTRDYIGRGMSPADARRAAAERFGDTARVRDVCAPILAAERAADERRLKVQMSWLDVKLGLRMFAKYPGLSLVSVVGLAVAIGLGAGYYAFIGAILDSTLPFNDGDRIVAIHTRSFSSAESEPTRLQDLQQWRHDVRTIDSLAAFSEHSRNLITADGRADLAGVAAMTASAFRLTGVAPALGRTILEEDERPGAPPVLVVGYDEWQRRFQSDRTVIGQTVRLDTTVHTIVGVMPQGFRFPVLHDYWVPLRLDASGEAAERRVHVFGRLAGGVTLGEARAEVATIGERMATAFPQTHRDTRLDVTPYTRAHGSFISGGADAEMAARSLQFGLGLLVLIVAVNVAVLVYARTATRLGEIAVRTALGASRARIVAQLFIEALFLSATAAAIGLALVAIGFRILVAYDAMNPYNGLPFWMELKLTAGVAGYAALLAILGAVMIGVVPALKATGRRVQAPLQQFSARASGVQLGRTWTALIVLQVAIAVAALPGAMHFAILAFEEGTLQPSPLAADMMQGRLSATMDDAQSAAERPARFTAGLTKLLQRLETEPGVTGVTFADVFPGREGYTGVEVEGRADLVPVRTSRVAPNLFEMFGVSVVAGRALSPADAKTDAIVVDQRLADALGGNVLGLRIRYSDEDAFGAPQSGPWQEIVGVVPVFWESFTAWMSFNPPLGRIYHAAATPQVHPATVIVRIPGGNPAQMTPRLREIAASVDPTLKFERVASVSSVWAEDTHAAYLAAVTVVIVTVTVLLLSSAGIYAMMSFTVARRRREIGIRTALGADGRRVLLGIFGRASAQLGTGVALGLSVALVLEWAGGGTLMGGNPLILVPGVIALMFTVGMLATLGPARRGLAIHPTEALREE